MDYPEGATPLDPDELKGLKFKHVTTRAQLDLLEQANIVEGLAWLSRQKSPDIFSINFVVKLHEKLFGQVWNWAGTFRQTEKNIGVDPRQISINLRDLIDDTRYWIAHETYTPIEIAARFHHRLVYIHLFANGNGRHARILTDALLTTTLKLKPVDWSAGLPLNKMSVRRSQYINALRAADGNIFEPLLNFMEQKH